MLKGLLLAAAIISLSGAQPAGTPQYAGKLLRFHEAYNRYFRDYFGCPKRAVDVSECRPAEGKINYGEYLKASKAVIGAFPDAKVR